MGLVEGDTVAEQDEAVQPEQKQRKPWQFQPGQSGNPSGRKKKDVAPLPPGDDDDLAAMRWVVRNKEDRTEAHRTYRAWLEEDRPGFMRALTALARVERKPADETPQEKQEAEAVEEDEATDRILELIAEAWQAHVNACTAAGGNRQSRLPGVAPEGAAEWQEYRDWKAEREEFKAWKAQRDAGRA